MGNNSALMVIDVQVAPFERKKYEPVELYNSEQVLANIAALISKARAAGTAVVYTQYTEGDDSVVWAKGSPFWEVHPMIKPQEGDIVIHKYHADPFYKTSLHDRLKALGIENLIITGLTTEFCVDTTCRTAFSLGYKNTFVTDGHSTFDSKLLSAAQIIEHHNGIIGSLFAQLKRAEEVEF